MLRIIPRKLTSKKLLIRTGIDEKNDINDVLSDLIINFPLINLLHLIKVKLIINENKNPIL